MEYKLKHVKHQSGNGYPFMCLKEPFTLWEYGSYHMAHITWATSVDPDQHAQPCRMFSIYAICLSIH
jgi:hypothetical protein